MLSVAAVHLDHGGLVTIGVGIRAGAIGCLRSGGVPFAVEARNAGSPGPASSFWLSDGFPKRERSIPFLTLASPPVIRDKNRMR